MRPSPTSLLLSGAVLLAAVLLAAAILPSDDYLFVPNQAEPVATKVKVAGGAEPSNGGGIYFVDVSVRRARWLERLLPFLRPDGASLVPQHAVTPPGQTFAEQRVEAREQMSRSERVAAAVALDAAGYDVHAAPRGVLIEGVAIDVPAAKALTAGDVIVAANGRSTKKVNALLDVLQQVDPGSKVRLRLRRNGETLTRTVETVAAPGEPDRAIVGIQVSQAANIHLPRKVTIDLGDVGGPSAGLPFALQVYQELGTDVDRGLRVAATGEIELDGSVAPVGGVKQKTFGVRDADADVFLVPAGDNAVTARRYAGGLRVIPVKSFRQALRVLKTLPAK